MRKVLMITVAMALLGSCKSPPKPPTVDESTKRPANTAAALELQSCHVALQNVRIVAEESRRAAEVAVQRLAVAERQRAPEPIHESGNSVYTVLFAFGATKLELPAADAREIVAEARNAPLVVVCGRTDGTIETPG